MKESYRVLEDGTVSVVDDNNFILKIERREYQDNIQEIFESENTEELLKTRKEEVINNINDNKYIIKRNKNIIKTLVLGLGLSGIIMILVGHFVVPGNEGLVALTAFLISVSLALPLSIVSNLTKENLSKEIKEYEDEIKKLDKAIELTKKRIQALKQDKTKEKLNAAKKIRIKL